MAIKTTVESNGKPPKIEIVDQNTIFFDHDTVIGRLVLARCLFNEQDGAKVYLVNNFHADPELLNPIEIFDMTNQGNLHGRILPFFKIELATHRDDKTPATLTLEHFLKPENIPLTAIPSSGEVHG